MTLGERNETSVKDLSLNRVSSYWVLILRLDLTNVCIFCITREIVLVVKFPMPLFSTVYLCRILNVTFSLLQRRFRTFNYIFVTFLHFFWVSVPSFGPIRGSSHSSVVIYLLTGGQNRWRIIVKNNLRRNEMWMSIQGSLRKLYSIR